jgi:hypothetical protein
LLQVERKKAEVLVLEQRTVKEREERKKRTREEKRDIRDEFKDTMKGIMGATTEEVIERMTMQSKSAWSPAAAVLPFVQLMPAICMFSAAS